MASTAETIGQPAVQVNGPARKKIWIDLDNSPHVPFFAPIIRELDRRGYSFLVTARDCFQVRELASLCGVKCHWIGRHYGKSKILKIAGLCIRASQLLRTVLRERPNLALSHGSRSQLLAARLLRMPSMLILDYEFARALGLLRPKWLMAPEIIDGEAIGSKGPILRYPGIKEDVYVPEFRPDPSIRSELGICDRDFVVTLRPPANEAHYHNPESELLLEEVFRRLKAQADVKVVLLPRNKKQEIAIRSQWGEMFSTGRIVVPPRAVDGLNLIWHSELVISGGGTMNREAAALGVPVYSIFRGHIGAVDRWLSRMGRLVLLESVEDVRTKIALQRRSRSVAPGSGNGETLKRVVENVVSALDSTYAAQ